VDEVFTIGMNRAVEVLAQKLASRGGRGATAAPLKELGDHPDGGAMVVMPGRYGAYVKWGKVNATLPKDTQPEDLTFEMALELVTEKAGKTGKPKAARKPAAKKAPAKAAAKTPAKAATKPPAKPATKAPAKKAAPRKKAAE